MADKSASAFEQLSSAAASLNRATDELKHVVENVDDALRRLNIGVSAWVEVGRWYDENDPQSYEFEQIGYSKIEGVWTLGIRRLVGHEQSPEPDQVRDVWQFNYAPRELRLRAVEKIPELLGELTKHLETTAEIFKKKLTEVKLITAGIGLPAAPKVSK